MGERIMDGVVVDQDLVMQARSDRLIRCFEKLPLQDMFGTEDARSRALRDTTFEEFERPYLWANAVSRGLNGRERKEEWNAAHMLHIEEDDAPADVRDFTSEHLLYCAPHPDAGRHAHRQAFEAAKDLDDVADSAMLLRLVGYFAHRSCNANTRISTLTYSLLTKGFSGSDEDVVRCHKILQGYESIKEIGLGIDAYILKREFADAYGRNLASYYHRDYHEWPKETTPLKAGDLAKQRANFTDAKSGLLGMALVERDMNIPFILDFMCCNGFDPNDYSVEREGKRLLDMPKLFDDLLYPDVNGGLAIAQRIKLKFLNSIINCFARGDESIYGSYKKLPARLAITVDRSIPT